MPLTFPSSPTVGQQTTQNGRVYAWTGSAWELAAVASNVTPSAHKLSHATGGTDALSPADIGAATQSHTHSASEVTSGQFDIARIPTGQTSSTVPLGNDARFTDQRVPTDGSVTDAKIATAGLSTSSLNWAAIAPWAANTAYAKGDLASFEGIAYRRSAAGASGSTFNAANWQQITPSSFVASQVASGTIAAARLPLSTNAQALAGTDAATVLTPAAMHVARRGSGRARFWEIFTDFTMDLSGNAPGSDGFIFGNQSSGASSGMNLFSNTSDLFTTPTAGILTVTTGTTSTGRGGFDSFQSRPHRTDTGTTTFETMIYLPLLASATEDYVLRIGYVRGNGIDLQCVCFEYDRAASANWRCVTGTEGNFSRSTTSVAVTETKWIKLAATWTSASAAFFINDVQVATNTQFIRPQSTWLGGHIIKTAGTTARTMLVDYFYARHDFTNERTFT